MKHRMFAWLFVVAALALATAAPASVRGAPPAEALTGASASKSFSLAPWFEGYIEPLSSVPNDVGAHVSIAFSTSDNAYISYYDATNQDLRVAHYVGLGGSGNCGPDNFWYCETVDSTGNVGLYSSIDVFRAFNGVYYYTRIGIAYYDATNGALKFAEYTCFLGCDWNIVTVQDAPVYGGAPSYGQYTSMKYNSSGGPLIAYYMSSTLFDDEVRRAYQVTSGGDCGEDSAAGKWECDTVDSGSSVGKYTSLDYSDFAGVYIAYYDGNAGNLKYAYFSGIGICGTGNTWYCVTVDGTDGSDVGKFVSMHVPDNANDELQFAYYDATNGKLIYATHVDGGGGNCGSGGFQCDEIADMGTGLTQAGISLAVDGDNHPVIAYQDASDAMGPATLNFAVPAWAVGMLIGNCGSGSLFYDWWCQTIDGGGSWTSEGDYAAIALNSAGLATIAYYENDSYYDPNLKIAYQRLQVFLPIVRK